MDRDDKMNFIIVKSHIMDINAKYVLRGIS